MTTLLLDHPDYQLTLQDGLLHLAHPDLPSRLYSLGQISRLMVGQGITLSSDLLLKLAERGIDFIAMGRRSCTHLCSLHHAPDSLRLIQYRAITQPDCQQQLVRRLLNARRLGQNCVLAQLGEPPLPPLLAEGFDPQLELHHVTGYRRPSLLLDIKELTRAELERWLLQLWQSHTLTAEHFTTSDQGCRLTRAGQQLFYPLWFGWQKTRKPRLRQLARVCRKVLEQTLKREVGHDH
ncbi:CRISPR-associated endonuclease Cas1 [Aeromonas sp. FDAARGOS 1405]|uniref:CRISPR-associated endonuclease Cas1 n=1 Tax=unclassified Aeromonas TaxID=257493 RepID=UPI001C217992|nr:CRISPR-associated endonuclease Cas1 [Aeromonas sp. FDAARGOS 1405]QXB28772.1 CRISPR-associated endonuclease Cas1 [Aeromonas sp. FDAARGOS 1405]